MGTLLVLSRDECLQLLGRGRVGRVAFTEQALPAIRPVTYSLVGSHLVIRTEAAGLGRRLDGQVVAFEVDEIDPVEQSGWSVVVTGSARLLREPGEVLRGQAHGPVSLAGPGREGVVVIVPGDITGRRLGLEHGAA